MERRGWFVVAAALAALVTLAGCITADEIGSLADEALERTSEQGSMTAEADEHEEEGVEAQAPPFYARSVVTVTGELTLGTLPVELSTVNGPILVDEGPEDEYELEVTLTGYGFTPEQAQDQRDRLQLEWGSGSTGDRHLFADIDLHDDASVQEGRAEGEIRLTIPRSVFVYLTTSTVNGNTTIGHVQAHLANAHATNGGLTFDELHAEAVRASTTNANLEGDIYATSSVSLSSTNGNLEATVHPGDSGSITASTTNGALTLAVPEAHAYGYHARAASTNGFVDVRLEDGRTDEEGPLVPQRAQFVTTNYDDRSIRTDLSLSSTNGNIVLEPS